MTQLNISLPPPKDSHDFDVWMAQTTQYLRDYLGLSYTKCVFDFMTPDQIADVEAKTLLVDVTTPIQTAITACAGKTIYFPTGKYLITSTLEVLAQTTLKGDGLDLQTVFVTPTDIVVLHAASTNPGTGAPVYGLSVEGIRFQNTKAVVAGVGITTFQIKFEEASLARIENCRFSSALLDADYNVNNAGGIWFTGGTSVFLNRVSKCVVQGRILMECTDSMISECAVWGHNGAYAIKLTGGNSAVQNCYDLNGSRSKGSVWLSNVSHCRIEGNFFDILGYGIISEYGACNTITGNTFNETADNPILLVDPISYTVVGNTFLNCGTLDSGTNSSDILIVGTHYSPIYNSFVGNQFRKVASRANPSYAIVEVNDGYAPTLNTYVGNTLNDTGAQYATPGILRQVTVGVTAGKLVGNVGKGTDREITATYTSTWASSGTQPALVNGTLAAEYTRVGDMVTATINLTMGSSTTYGTGDYTFTLPTTVGATDCIGTIYAYDSGSNVCYTGACIAVATDNRVSFMTSSGGARNAPWGQTVPMTWASGDNFKLTISYISI